MTINLVEKVAKALCWVDKPYDDLHENAKAQWCHDARRAIRAVIEHLVNEENKADYKAIAFLMRELESKPTPPPEGR